MLDAILSGLSALIAGFSDLGGANLIMLAIAGVMFYLAIAKDVEPLLLLPIAFGCFLVNLPLSEVMHADGVLRSMYNMGIENELFPLLIFVGIGSMTDFKPLLAEPKLLLFGAAGQLGIFATLLLAAHPALRPGSGSRQHQGDRRLHRGHRRLRRSHGHLRLQPVRRPR